VAAIEQEFDPQIAATIWVSMPNWFENPLAK
jgi:hypothetical protein